MTLDDFPKDDQGHHMGVVKATRERVRVLCVDAVGRCPIVIVHVGDGLLQYAEAHDITPALPRREYWINEYPNGGCVGHSAKELADYKAYPDRIGPARHVVFED